MGAGIVKQRGRIGVAGNQKEMTARNSVSNKDGGFNPVHGSHHDVADNDLRLDSHRSFDRLLAAVDSSGLKSFLIKD
jgi:hypothetical protein